jgi:hypothetical protein
MRHKTIHCITEYRDQCMANGLTFTPVQLYWRYFFLCMVCPRRLEDVHLRLVYPFDTKSLTPPTSKGEAYDGYQTKAPHWWWCWFWIMCCKFADLKEGYIKVWLVQGSWSPKHSSNGLYILDAWLDPSLNVDASSWVEYFLEFMQIHSNDLQLALATLPWLIHSFKKISKSLKLVISMSRWLITNFGTFKFLSFFSSLQWFANGPHYTS